MIIEEARKFIAANGLGAFDPDGGNVDVFLEVMPDGDDVPDEAICLYSTGGEPDAGAGIGKPGFQLIVRGRDLTQLMERAKALRALFNNQYGTQFCADGTDVLICRCQQSEPMHIGIDDNGRHEYSNTFLVTTGGS